MKTFSNHVGLQSNSYDVGSNLRKIDYFISPSVASADKWYYIVYIFTSSSTPVFFLLHCIRSLLIFSILPTQLSGNSSDI